MNEGGGRSGEKITTYRRIFLFLFCQVKYNIYNFGMIWSDEFVTACDDMGLDRVVVTIAEIFEITIRNTQKMGRACGAYG